VTVSVFRGREPWRSAYARHNDEDEDELRPLRAEAAEEAIISAILKDAGVMARIDQALQPEAFTQPKFREMFAAARAIDGRGDLVDHPLLIQELKNPEYRISPDAVADVDLGAGYAANVGQYVALVLECSERRDGVQFGQRIAEDAVRGLDWRSVAAEVDLSSQKSLSSHQTSFPEPMDIDAWHGLAGEFVAAVRLFSEASDESLMAHFLTAAAALIGPKVHAEAGDANHPARLNIALVGESSKGRKGSSWQPVRRLLDLAASGFTSGNVVGGLSSGEGLIWAVRNPITKLETVGKGAERRREEVEVDPGVSDKRLLVVESELAMALRVMQRDGNTLTAVIREAWDKSELATLVKNSPARATGAHICIAGHVTREELIRYLDRTELANGFANRFLFFASKRSRVLPEGESAPLEVLTPVAEQLREVCEWGSTPRLLHRDDEAATLWREMYAELSEGRPGLIGSVTNRAEAQVLRLSVLYAALDCSERIRSEHLMAALAIWKYADASAGWVFGNATGNPDADAVLALLRANGGEMERGAIVKALSGHVFGGRLDRALGILKEAGMMTSAKVATGGRPSEAWRVI
jgi:hypothetical protein